MKRLFLVAISLILLTGCTGGVSAKDTNSFVAGNGTVTFIKESARKSAPALSGKSLDGNQIILAQGSVAVINVWASWCAPCRAEAPTLSALSSKYKEVNFLGILTRDNPANAQAFVRRFKIKYPTLVDDRVLLGFRGQLVPNAIPSTLIIDKQGRVAARVSGEITVASLSKLIEQVQAE